MEVNCGRGLGDHCCGDIHINQHAVVKGLLAHVSALGGFGIIHVDSVGNVNPQIISRKTGFTRGISASYLGILRRKAGDHY